MTQLVELQEHIEEFEAAGIKVYAVSYDSPRALAAFAERYGITYDLLSDSGSEVIKRYGILNTLIGDDHPAAARMNGIPFPGTYVTDAEGRVTEKFFNRHYGTRESAGTILDKAIGQAFVHAGAPYSGFSDNRAKVSAWLSDKTLKLESKRTLYVRVEMAEGLHVYGEPLPDGFFATTVQVKPVKGVRFGEPIYPPTKPKRFEALGTTLNVYEGVFEVQIPVIATAEVLNWGQERTVESIVLDVTVNYQACSDTVCYAPETRRVPIKAPLDELVRPAR